MKLFRLLIIFFLIINFSNSSTAHGAEIDSRVKAFLMMTTYGTAGGLLLGTATLAFDAPGRAPFIGASLGLYAGLIFGSYVVVTHYLNEDRRLNPQKYMDDEQDDGLGDYGNYGETPNQLINQYDLSRDLNTWAKQSTHKKIFQAQQVPDIYLPLINYKF